MADNLDDEIIDNSTTPNPKEPENENISPTDAEIIPSNKEIKDMEVHHHPNLHHNPKPWKEYLLEGLMIFIAVCMGFIAENIHEHISNKEIEKRNMEIVVGNLNDDNAQLKYCISGNEQVIKALDTLISFQDFHNTDTLQSNRFYDLFTRGFSNHYFFSNTAAIDQMKSSGSLRLIKNKMVLNGIFNYENENEVIASNKAYLDILFDKGLEDASMFLNFRDVSTLPVLTAQNDRKNSPATNQQIIFKFFNEVALRKVTLEGFYLPQLKEQQKNAGALIRLLEKEYNIKDE